MALVAASVLVLAAGCGGGSGGAPRGGGGGGKPALRVTLDLKGGRSQDLKACGVVHHYAVFTSRAGQEFAGAVAPTPTGRWKVKLKLKACRHGAFTTIAKLPATRDKHTGAFRGVLPRLPQGAYFARASVYVNGVRRAESDKRHFAIR